MHVGFSFLKGRENGRTQDAKTKKTERHKGSETSIKEEKYKTKRNMERKGKRQSAEKQHIAQLCCVVCSGRSSFILFP